MHTFRTLPMENFGSPCMVCVSKDKFFIFCWHVCAPKSYVAEYRPETKEQLFITHRHKCGFLTRYVNLSLGLISRFSFPPFAQDPSPAAKIFTPCVLCEMAILFSHVDHWVVPLVFPCPLLHNISNYKPLALYSHLTPDMPVPLGSVVLWGRH